MTITDSDITDKDIDEGLQRLAQLAPGESAWADIENALLPQQTLASRLLGSRCQDNRYIAVGGGLAAALVLGIALGFYLSGNFHGSMPGPTPGQTPGDLASGLSGEGFGQNPDDSESLTQISTLKNSELDRLTVDAELPVQVINKHLGTEEVFKYKTEETVRGKYVRHLYGGEEALWDAMLEEEIHLVDMAILRSSPAQQRQLWTYRKNLIKQLATLRYQQVPDKYLF